MLTVIHLDFTLEQYTVMESAGYVAIGIMLSGGISTSSITVVVTPTEQSPISAIGRSCVRTYKIISLTLMNFLYQDHLSTLILIHST